MWIILEFVAGGNLYSLLSSTARELPWDIRIRIALQAAKAVNFLHSRGSGSQILHQDIKSLNFLLSKGSLDVKLTDFGMATAKIAATATVSSKFTSSVGSYRWSAPETLAKNPAWSEKCDIYSLGMTFYEIASRSIPFLEVFESHQVMYMVKVERERPDIPADCPPDFAELIRKCWDQEPANRPSSTEVLQILAEMASKLEAPAGKARRLFFELDKEELLRMVPEELVTTLTEAPPFPSQSDTPPTVPQTVKLVTLKRDKVNPLMSKSYDAQLFERVEVYFRRFFQPHDSSAKVILEQVDVILNDQVEKRFRESEERMHKKFGGLAELDDDAQSTLQLNYLERLQTSENLVTTRNSNPTTVWHGANTANIPSIAWYGMLNLSTTDPGYFGQAMYFTQHPKYGEYYAERVKEKSEGRFNLVLCWALIGRPFAITKVDMGCQCKPGYTSHYTLVTRKQADPGFCVRRGDFENVQGMTSYFPVVIGEEVQGDEIALFEPSHVLPRFVVHYSVIVSPDKVFSPQMSSPYILNAAIHSPAPTPQPVQPPKSTSPVPTTTSPVPTTTSPAPKPYASKKIQLASMVLPQSPESKFPPIHVRDQQKAEEYTHEYHGKCMTPDLAHDGLVPLSVATKKIEDPLLIRVLCELGADVDYMDKDGYLPIFYTVEKQESLAMLKMLLLCGASAHKFSSRGQLPLHIAAKFGNYTAVEELIMVANADVNAPGRHHGPALTLCRVNTPTFSVNAHENALAKEITEWILLTLGATDQSSVGSATGNGTGFTPLHLQAYTSGYVLGTSILEEVSAKNINGVTPLFVAAWKGHYVVAEQLLKLGALVDARGPHGETALHAAARFGHVPLVQLLIDHGADVNDVENRHSYSALYLASMYGHATVVKELGKLDINVHSQDSTGLTPIAIASIHKRKEVVEELIKLGSVPDLIDKQGNTALLGLMLHRDKDNMDCEVQIITMLLKAGADVNAKNAAGQSPLGLSKEDKTKTSLTWLLRKHGAVDCLVM